MQIVSLKTPHQLLDSFDVFAVLRAHLTSKESFVAQVIEQQKQGYEIAAIQRCDEIIACVGFRFITSLACGKILYIDDLATKENARGKGCASMLLKHVIEIASLCKCDAIHLDTGYTRHAAHKLYLKHGFEIACHHMKLNLK